ncbi:hypothetical protein [Cupriavidus sp. TMH.W2]|uniref:hypothetical protein n=1 Tax=Cupriavidus sp. TMH.W2 TaxID=3434465 RepID=UPI003D778C63
MPMFEVTILKAAEVEVEADNAAAAVQIVRNQDADGVLGYDTQASATPVVFGAHPLSHWLRRLDEERNVSVYEADNMPGHFGYTGCEADNFQTMEEATLAAVLANDLIVNGVQQPEPVPVAGTATANLDIYRMLADDGVTSYCEQICGGGQCGTGQLCHKGVDLMTEMPAPLCDKYADSVIGDQPHLFDAIEIHGARDMHPENDPRGTCFEVDNENPQIIAVYLRLKEGGLMCAGDFGAYDLANGYASELGSNYSWPVHSFVSADLQASAMH